MHIILVKFTLNITEKDNTNFTVLFPGKTMLSYKILQNPARFSNFGFNSPEWQVGLLFLI